MRPINSVKSFLLWITGCKNFSAVQRLGEHEIYATDWKMKLHTAEKVAEDITHVGIRGHWIRPEEKPGENCLEVQVDEYIETTFEHQYMIRKKDEEAAATGTYDAAEIKISLQ